MTYFRHKSGSRFLYNLFQKEVAQNNPRKIIQKHDRCENFSLFTATKIKYVKTCKNPFPSASPYSATARLLGDEAKEKLIKSQDIRLRTRFYKMEAQKEAG